MAADIGATWQAQASMGRNQGRDPRRWMGCEDAGGHGGWGELTDHVGSPPTEQERLNREGRIQGLMGNAEADSGVSRVGSDVAEWTPHQGLPTQEAERQGKPRMPQF